MLFLLPLLCGFFINQFGFCAFFDAFARYDHFFHILLGRNVVHHVSHNAFDDRTQPSRASLQANCGIGDLADGSVFHRQFYAVKPHQLLILFDDRVLGLRENVHQSGFVELL